LRKKKTELATEPEVKIIYPNKAPNIFSEIFEPLKEAREQQSKGMQQILDEGAIEIEIETEICRQLKRIADSLQNIAEK
jgi:hypothetical protein